MLSLRAFFLRSLALLWLLASAQAVPTIVYPELTRGAPINRTLTGWATIVDTAGTVASGANAPRLYYKRLSDDDAFLGNTAADNGWKYVIATGGSGSAYSFVIDYSIIFGGGSLIETDVLAGIAGDKIQYFVVAQDEANNLISSPAGAVASANPPVQNISARPDAIIPAYDIVPALSGTVMIPGNFSNLTGLEGFFFGLASRSLTGNVTAKVVTDVIESGLVPALAISSNDYPNLYTATIQPDSATMRTLAGTGIAGAGLIRLSGVKGLTIDGSFGGSGRYLTFRSTSPNTSTVLITDDASNNTIRNCVIEGAGKTGVAETEVTRSVVFFGVGVTMGNDHNTISGNQIRDLSDRVGVPHTLIGSKADSTTVMNSNNTIDHNDLFNFGGAAMNMPFTGIGAGLPSNESWSITGNTIYQTAARTGPLLGIAYEGYGTNTIRGNTVRDLTSDGVFCIRLKLYGGSGIIADNHVRNINAPGILGISSESGTGTSATVINNMVALGNDRPQQLIGIALSGAVDGTTLVAHNTVLFTGDGGAGADTFAYLAAAPATVKNNLFLNLRTGSGNRYAVASGTGLVLDHNVYAGTGGATAANFFGTSNGNGITPVDFEQWKQTVSGDAHSNAGNPGGEYTSALFVDPANGDLHLAGESALAIGAGEALAAVTTDFDGHARNVLPDIGADESTAIARLSGLVISSGTLTPVFDKATLAYAAKVSNATTSITLTPAVTRPVSSITVNGTAVASGAASGPLTLVEGDNVLTTRVTALNGTSTNDYMVTVHRNARPVLTLPTSPVAALAPTLGGVAVNFTTTANDLEDGTLTPTLSAQSGDVFPLGDTTVNVSGTDNEGVTATGSFVVSVHLENPVNTKVLVAGTMGDAAPGRMASADLPDDAVLASFGLPAVDAAGGIAFVAKWTSKTGPVKRGSGLFLNNACLAVVGGDASAIGGAGAKWKSFSDPVLEAGRVVSIAKLSTGASAVVSNFTGAALEKIALTGEDAADEGDAKFKKFTAVALRGGSLGFAAQITGGTGASKVTPARDLGLWIRETGGPLRRVYLDGFDLGGDQIVSSFVSFQPGLGSPGQGRGWLSYNGQGLVLTLNTFTNKTKGIVFGGFGGDTFLARTGETGTNFAPALAGVSFDSFRFPAMNDALQNAFYATMKVGAGGVKKTDAGGIFAGAADFSGSLAPYELLARVGGDAALAGPGATFKQLKDPVLSADGDITFPATVKGVKGAGGQTLWWKPAGQPLALLAQGGSDAGDLTGAKWKAFASLAIAGGGRGPIFVATLTPNKTNVTKANANGVWATDFEDNIRTLFRTGVPNEIIAGKTLKRFTLLKASVGNVGVTRSFNDAAQVVWLATFTDKTTAIITTHVP